MWMYGSIHEKLQYCLIKSWKSAIKSVILVCLLGISVYSSMPRLFTIALLDFDTFREGHPHLVVTWMEYNPCNPCYCTSSVCQQYLDKEHQLLFFLLRNLCCIYFQWIFFEFSTSKQELILSFKLVWCVFLLSNKAPTLFLWQFDNFWMV